MWIRIFHTKNCIVFIYNVLQHNDRRKSNHRSERLRRLVYENVQMKVVMGLSVTLHICVCFSVSNKMIQEYQCAFQGRLCIVFYFKDNIDFSLCYPS